MTVINLQASLIAQGKGKLYQTLLYTQINLHTKY